MELTLDGKVALVTGGSRGIGKAIATAFCEAGASCMLVSRKEHDLREAAASIPGRVDFHVGNVGNEEDAVACVAATLERLGRLDVLVNNAATNPYFGPMIDIDIPRYDKTVQVNLRGPLLWTQQAWRQTMQERGGVVLNIVSCGAFTYDRNLGVYGMTKAGLVHHTKQLAVELGPRVRVNAIAPAFVPTAMSARSGGTDMVAEEWGLRVPLQRSGTVEDVAAAALFVASDRSSWMTGQVVVLDGGMSVEFLKGADA